ncbi:MAG: MoxR family ATPase [Eubacteriales bacterium]|nr:MoxR family ATPase [Eubacteriales bacterium]
MNIQEAKEEIIHTIRAYHRKDTYGNYLYPIDQQRPVLLIGPPGIGKTAIVSQAAEECGIGLVSYTLTHHTRQSAIGLPKIVKHRYGEQETEVTEYTMSEIIASVYSCMEQTGREEGILFIDEINCVSETLLPVMLQFLQNKTFGTHRVPDGWMIVAAGNPKEYSRSVRELDIAVMDRVRKIELEPDLPAWKIYAEQKDMHPAILAYLDMHAEHFYSAGQGENGPYFVTARGWENLSELIKNYEALEIPITVQQIREFLNRKDIAEGFAAYWRLFCRYHADYEVKAFLDLAAARKSDREMEEEADRILEKQRRMAENADLEERYTVVYQLLAVFNRKLQERNEALQTGAGLMRMAEQLDRYESEAGKSFSEETERILQVRVRNQLLTAGEAAEERKLLGILKECEIENRLEHGDAVTLKKRLRGKAEVCRRCAEEQKRELSHMLSAMFIFCLHVFNNDAELMLLVSGTARNSEAQRLLMEEENSYFMHYSHMFFE